MRTRARAAASFTRSVPPSGDRSLFDARIRPVIAAGPRRPNRARQAALSTRCI
ncbi:hypothetical protein D512_09258 [Burkholderia pseudomallei MSHR1043]|nr:hypothetical protein BURPS668_1793 [Burkholderia pseudomallei 668]EDU07525.1 hypothetical protein BURPS1655_A1982 [Burkholderia pseudomallei 1655]EMP77086.1 hypothetical protein D512_09258 [Burkholderia pseudomallei MSHR1043]